jgi:putative ABC transport system permease protein
MTGWRALLRLAARDARRDRWRTLLVVALIALPVAGLGAAVGITDTTQPTAEERVRDSHGEADLLLRFDSSQPDEAELGLEALAAELPDGSVIHPQWSAADGMVLDGRLVRAELENTAPGATSLTNTRYRVVDGRAPSGDREVVVSSRFAERHGLEIGDALELEELGPVTVTGTVVRPEFLFDVPILFAPEARFPAELEPRLDSALVAIATPPTTFTLDLDASFDEGGLVWVESREDAMLYRFTENDRFAATVIGGLGAVEVALIAGAAFAVSVRRRQRELGLLAAVGGSQRQVRRVVQLTGLVAGGIGALLGLALAIATVYLAQPLYSDTVGREIAGPRFDVAWLLAVAVLGALAAVIGAALPGRAVARLPIVVALSGRRPVTVPSRRGLLAGLAVASVGIVLLGAVAFGLQLDQRPGPVPYLIGSVLVVLGFGAMSPWALERLAALAPRLPVGPRLAVRDAARFRTRNGPIVTAAMAGLAAMLTITTVFGSLDRDARESYQPSLAYDLVVFDGESAGPVAAALASEVGGQVAALGWVGVEVLTTDGTPLNSWPAVADVEAARVLGGDDAAAALAAGQAVVFHPVPGSELVLGSSDALDWDEDGPILATSETVEVFEASPSSPGSWVAPLLLPADFAADLVARDVAELSGAAPSVTEVAAEQYVVRLDAPVDAEVVAAASRLTRTVEGVSFRAEQGYVSEDRALLLLTTIAGGIVSLALVAVALALASAEARADGRAMAAIGAGRRTRRSLAAGRALLLAGLAGVLAVPVGAIPAIALLTRLRPGALVVQVPWIPLAVALLVVPLLAAGGAAIAAGRAPKPALRLAA